MRGVRLAGSAELPGGGDLVAFRRLFVVLRVFTGLVWLSNGIAKAAGRSGFDWGVVSFTLIDRSGARGILDDAAHRTAIRPLGGAYEHVVLAHWGFWAVFLTIAELAIGLALILGVAPRRAALAGIMLIAPVWVMLWHSGLYLWEYPAEDLLPLALLAAMPAGGRGRVQAVAARMRRPR